MNDSRPSSSSGILQHSLTSPLQSPRRIRFAPLPDPRRSVLVTEDGQELPIPNHEEDQLQDTSATDVLPTITTTISSSSSSSSSTNASATSTPNTVTPASSVRSSPVSQNTALPVSKQLDDSSSSNNNPPSAWPRSLFLLRPFKRNSTSSSGSSSHSLTPTPSIEQARSSSKRPLSTEEILTLGTINLFRTASKESRSGKEKENDVGWGLSRWSSASGPSSVDRTSLLATSSPLARTQSAGSYSSKSKKAKKGIGISLFSASSSSSLSSDAAAAAAAASVSSSDPKRPNPRPTTTPAKASKYKGTRMLNGRVYGAPKNHHLKANPFATARDEEPEFVEWGYGGMGSVKGAKSAGVSGNGVNWSRLSGGSVLKDSSTDESRPSSGAADRDDDDDDEDGSGMGWVRRRREERERKKREEEAAAKNALAVPETTSQDTTPTPTRSSTLDAAAFEETAMSYPTEDIDATPMGAPHTSPFIPSKPVHITEAITIPVHLPHHHHHRSHSYGHGRTRSKEALEITFDEPIDDSAPTSAMSSESAMVTPTPATVHAAASPITTRHRSDSNASTDTSASETDSDSESEDARTPGDEEEDEEDEKEMERRKTALGAGVEKISRHGASAHA